MTDEAKVLCMATGLLMEELDHNLNCSPFFITMGRTKLALDENYDISVDRIETFLAGAISLAVGMGMEQAAVETAMERAKASAKKVLADPALMRELTAMALGRLAARDN